MTSKRSLRFCRHLRAGLAALLALTANPVVAGTEEGIEALRAGNPEKAFNELKPPAEQGDPKAQQALGTLYRHGLYVDKDPVQAFRWFQKSLAGGNVAAAVDLGLAYKRGEGVEKDVERAVELYRRAAEAGVTQGQTNLGLAYRQGTGVEQDFEKAARWLEPAAKQGAVNAQAALAYLYAYDKGVPKNSERALNLARKAASNGDPEDEALYGVLLDRAGNKRKAYKWHARAAIDAQAESMRYVGLTLWRGQIVKRRPLLATAWVGLAAQIDPDRSGDEFKRMKARLSSEQMQRVNRLVQSIGDTPKEYIPAPKGHASNGGNEGS